MEERGGVGLVFVNDAGGSMFLHVARVVPDGPADMSGMLSPGDRLVAIDGIEIGTAPPGDSPQLPGPHGTPVTLTFHRAANGRAFYEGCEVYVFNVNLTRSRNFFPDKLTQQALPVQGNLHIAAPSDTPTALMAPTFSDGDFMKFGTPTTPAPIEHDSKLVDDILRSLGSPYAGEAKPPVWPSPTLPSSPGSASQAPLPPRSHGNSIELSSSPGVSDDVRTLHAQNKNIQQNLIAANDKIRLLEDQLSREREQATSVQASQEASIRSLMQQQTKSTELVGELRQFIETQSEQLKTARRGEAATEEEKRKMDEHAEKTSAALGALNAEVRGARQERDAVRKELHCTMLELEAALKEATLKKQAEDIAKKAKEREELMKKKAESLAKEIVRLRTEIKRGAAHSESSETESKKVSEKTKEETNKGHDKEQFLLGQILRLREENEEFRRHAGASTQKIGLEAQSAGPPVSPAKSPPREHNVKEASASPVEKGRARAATRSASPPPPAMANNDLLASSVKLDLELNMPISEALVDEHAFCVQLKADVAQAVEGDAAKIQVLRLQPGSVIATLQLDAGIQQDGSTPLDCARALADQAVDPRSLLRKGVLTSFTTSVRSILVVKQDDKEIVGMKTPAAKLPPTMLQVSVGKGRNIPVRQGLQDSFIVVRVNDIDVGITEQQSGAEPCFMQEFKSQVMADNDTMVSLSFHQQDSEGRHVLLGYVAVPLQRVLQSGREEGWYDLRSNKDGLVQGVGGIAEVLVAMTVSTLPPPPDGEPPALAPAGNAGGLGLGSLLRPKALLEVLVGRTRYVDVDGFPRKLVCTLHPGNTAEPGPVRASRKTIGVMPRPDAVFNQGFQIPVYSTATETLTIEVGDDPIDNLDPNGNRLQLARYFGACQVHLSEIYEQLEARTGAAHVTGWHVLHDSDADARPGSAPALLLAFALREIPEGEALSAAEVSGWLRPRQEQAELFFVLDCWMQVLMGFPSEGSAKKQPPVVEYEVRGCSIGGVTSVEKSGEVLFDLSCEHSAMVRLAAPSQSEWERWFDILYRTGKAHTLTADVFESLATHAGDTPEAVCRLDSAPDLVPPAPAQKATRSAAPPFQPPEPSLPASPGPDSLQNHPALDTEAKPDPEPALVIERPDTVLEVFMLKARNIPFIDMEGSSAHKVVGLIQYGSESYQSRPSWPTPDPVWNESVQFAVSRDMANDLITVMLFVQALSGEPDNVFLGHIAVPASRVVQAGREEGWYDLRGKQGDVIQGGDGAASVLMSLVASPAKPLPHHVQGFMLSKVSADVEDGDGFEKRYHLLNPYKQQLVIYTRLPLPGISEGLIHSVWNVRDCEASVIGGSELATAIARASTKPPGGVDDHFAFMLSTVQGQVVCCSDTADSRDMWVKTLGEIGHVAAMRELDMTRRTTGPLPKSVETAMQNLEESKRTSPPLPMPAPSLVRMQVIIEKARRLPAHVPAGDAGYFCVVQLGEKKVTTQVVTGDDPRWRETFEMPVADVASELVTVQLWWVPEAGVEEAVGHVAVPAARVQASSSEEGWYEIRSRDGSLVTGVKGKASILIRFRCLA